MWSRQGGSRERPLYPGSEVDDPVELHDHAGFALLESKLAVFQARAGPEQSPGEAAGLPDAHVALQLAAVPVLGGLVWRTTQEFEGGDASGLSRHLRTRSLDLPPQSSNFIGSVWASSSYLARNSLRALV